MSTSTTKQLRTRVQYRKRNQKISTSRDDTIEALDQSDVAALSPVQISRMTCEELVRIIRAARLPLVRPEIDEHLEFYDRPTLERLVYLARRCCRNRRF